MLSWKRPKQPITTPSTRGRGLRKIITESENFPFFPRPTLETKTARRL
ncbi:unnamed protein product [Ectocarpus sp. 8 AP-2014]